MIRRIFLSLLLCFWATIAYAQVMYSGLSIPTRGPVPADSIGVENAWYLDLLSGNVYGPKNIGHWSPGPVAQLGTGLYNLASFGAICNGQAVNGTADTHAINTLFAQLRLLPLPGTPAVNGSHPVITFPGNPSVNASQNNSCYINSTINATSAGGGADALSSQIYLQMRNGRFECHTNGQPCLDMCGAQFYSFDGVVFNSPDGTDEPSYGIQLCRLQTGQPAGGHFFNNVIVQGSYGIASVLSFASEVNTWVKSNISNNDTRNPLAAAQYAFIDDGCNHFSVTSQFQTVTIPPSTPTSDKLLQFDGGQISIGPGTSYVAPLFMCNTIDHRYYGTYINSNSLYAIHYFGVGAGNPVNSDFKVNIEGPNVQNVFLLENNSNPTQTYNGIHFNSGTLTGQTSIFGVAGGHIPLTSVTINNLNLHIQSTAFPNIKLLDNPALYSLNGTVNLPSINNWSPPVRPLSLSSLTVCLFNQVPSCTVPTPTAPINRNPDFLIDQPNEGNANLITASGKIVTDGYHANWSGSFGSDLTFQQNASAGQPANFPFTYNLQTTVTASATPGATDWYDVTTNIDGADIDILRYGAGAQGNYAMLHYCAWSSVAPITPPIYLSNGTLYYNIDDTITTASSWTCFAHLIPPATTGTWQRAPNTIGLTLGLTYANGSTNSSGCVDGVWQSQTCRSTPASSQLIAQPTNSVFHIAYFHIFPGIMDQPELAIPYNQQFAAAQRWYAKSFRSGPGNAPVQNIGSNAGAILIQAPYAQATFGSVASRIPFPVRMWTGQNTHLPAITFFSTNAASANCYNQTRAQDSGAAAATNISDSSFIETCTLVAGDAIGNQLYSHFTADNGF